MYVNIKCMLIMYVNKNNTLMKFKYYHFQINS